MSRRRKFFAIALCGIMLMTAGCTGWGTDGPADQNDSESDGADELEDAQDGADADTNDESDAGTDVADDSDGTADNSSSDDGGSGGATTGDTADTDDSDTSDEADSNTDDGGGDDSTDDGETDDESSDPSDESDGDTGDDASDGSTGDSVDSSDGTEDDSDQGDGDASAEQTVTISVVDQDGAPVTDGAVTLLGPDAGILGDQAIDANGQVQFTVGEPGTYSYNVYDAEGYEDASDDRSFAVDGDEDIELTAEMEATQQSADPSDVLIEDVEWATTEAGDGEQDAVILRNTNEEYPLDTSGWEIYTDAEAMTVPLGVEEIGPGESVGVSAMLDGMNGGLITVYDSEGTEVATSNYDEHPEWGASGPATLSVDIVDEDGAGVSNASVTLIHLDSGTEQTASADESGTAVIDDLPAGEYDVEASADGYESATESVVLEDGEDRTLQIALTGEDDASLLLQGSSVGVAA